MCAPCKIILDEGVAAAAAGEPVVPAMAKATARMAYEGRLPDKLTNRLSRIDAEFLRAALAGPEGVERGRDEPWWLNETLRALSEELGVEGL